MTRHLHQDIELLKRKILFLSAEVEEAVQKSLLAFNKIDKELAEEVVRKDIEIDKMEIEVEEDGLKILALHQPVAIDLRFLVAILKINNGLERIGDLAVNIAELALSRSPESALQTPADLDVMVAKSRSMLTRSLDALVNLDVATARSVFADDDEVDAILRDMFRYVKQNVTGDSENVESLLQLLFVARHLERIADLATNIAEDIIYMVEGKIVRHGAESN